MARKTPLQVSGLADWCCFGCVCATAHTNDFLLVLNASNLHPVSPCTYNPHVSDDSLGKKAQEKMLQAVVNMAA